MSATRAPVKINEIGRIVITVSDQDRALDFYANTLGFEVRSDQPFGDGNRWLELGPQGATTGIALMLPIQGQSTGYQTGVIFGTTDIDALHAELRGRGVDVDQQVMRMGGPVPPMFQFRDPDGNTLAVVQAP
jgi:predicted enzyme related to lactoylglutathione lyase